MSGIWRVTSNLIGGKKMYAVYRLRDADRTDHSGNREYFGDYVDNRDFAEQTAEMLNAETV